jgi:hypothetical protein
MDTNNIVVGALSLLFIALSIGTVTGLYSLHMIGLNIGSSSEMVAAVSLGFAGGIGFILILFRSRHPAPAKPQRRSK